MKNSLIIPILSMILISVSCSKKENPADVNSKNFIYPLARGNQWQYVGQAYFNNFRGDSNVVLIPDTTFQDITLEVTGQELLPNNILVYKLYESVAETSATRGTRQFDRESYYNNFGDGLYLYGYIGRSDLTLKTNPQNISENNRFYFDEISGLHGELNLDFIQTQVTQDTLTLVDPASKSLQYPLAPGETWTHNTNTGTKEVLEIIDVTVPAGIFECAKVEWHLSDSYDLLDYISADGLVKRTIIFKDLTIITTNRPNGIGVADYVNEFFLTNVNLEE